MIGADHTSDDVHHDDIYIQQDNGQIAYYTTIPARLANSANPDAGLLFHFFTRDSTTRTLYATSSLVDGLSSDLSEGLTLGISYDSFGCTEQTVPVAAAGDDQIVPVGAPVTLDASGSFDPFGTDTANLIYRWQCFAAPEEVTLSDGGQAAVTTFTPNTTGHYYFRLNVRDDFGGGSFNRSPVDYVRVSAVADPDDPNLLDVNSDRPQQAEVGEVITLDGSRTRAPDGATYRWEQTNPLGETAVADLADILGTDNCTGECYKTNFDADSDADGSDLALLANNLGAVTITDADQPMAQFSAGIARPHIFRLTVNDGATLASETTIVAVNHPRVSEVLTPPPVDTNCLTP